VTTAAEQFRILAAIAERVVPEDEFRAKLERSVSGGRPLRVKLGIDPSAPDIHLGHAVPLRALRRFQDLGHTAVLIIGDFTARIGDPSGQSATRPVLHGDSVREFAETYIQQVKKILREENLEIRWNSEWLEQLGTEGLLTLAVQFNVARMLERDDFKTRYSEGKPITIAEFLYPLLQGQDSVAVEADVEIGGTDQTFNLLVGRDLQRNAHRSPQVAYVLPLLEGLDGVQKMSKSLGNYVGIDDRPEDIFGKLMRIPDRLIGKYLRLTTDLDASDIAGLERRAAEGGPAAAEVKRALARRVVELYHSPSAASDAERHFDTLFREHRVPDDVPEQPIPPECVSPDGMVSVARLLSTLGLVRSSSEARRKMKESGVRLDGDPIKDPDASLPIDRLEGQVLQVGKKRFVRLTGAPSI
jgi:tyrosyl-tRNA synthetase